MFLNDDYEDDGFDHLPEPEGYCNCDTEDVFNGWCDCQNDESIHLHCDYCGTIYNRVYFKEE